MRWQIILWCYDKIHRQRQDRPLKNQRQFVLKITNCQIVRSRLLTHHINYKFMCLLLSQKACTIEEYLVRILL